MRIFKSFILLFIIFNFFNDQAKSNLSIDTDLKILKAQSEEGNPDAKFYLGSLYYIGSCLLYTSPSPRDLSTSRMPSSA